MFNVLLGGFFIVLGFLVKKYPDLIAGYNTMPEEQKKNVDIDGLSSMMRVGLVAMGLLIALGKPMFNLIGWQVSWPVLMMSTILSIAFLLVILAPRYDRNLPPWYKRYLPAATIIVIAVVVGVAMSKSNKPPVVSLTQGQISITGSYGLTKEVGEIELLPTIPKILRKNGGYNNGPIRKGNFLLEEWGSCLLFLQSGSGPFIKISTNDKPIVINEESPEGTKVLYGQLTIEFNKQD
ncbi:MAG: DUF3784 domain-containing protein [Cyclobacteriaceae bacterium]